MGEDAAEESVKTEQGVMPHRFLNEFVL